MYQLKKILFNRYLTIFSILILSVFNNNISYCQYILNGGFELNNAPSGVDQIALTNQQFNSLVLHCTSFGINTEGLDLITTDSFDGGALCGDWYLGIEGGGVEVLSMELSSPLTQGVEYKITFYDRGRDVHCPAPIQIGLSSLNDDFGEEIYIAPTPTIGEWRLRCFTFVAQNNAEYITVRAGNTTGCWTKVDCFEIEESNSPCFEFIMPNVFTPNDDGVNDIFKPVSYQGIKEGTLTIINRWGNKVFETNDINSGWNGLHNNKECTEGVYYWIVTYTDIFDETKTENGFLTLIR